ncbi:MAG: M20/M25/M40 family metallo-hydrolase, partial [Candidatus Rokuibacteriota bacterium]
EVDDAGHRVGGETGNLVARFDGTAPSAPPFLLSAHMDTVVPGDNIRPVLRDDVIRSDGTTVLGGDDKSGIVAILEAIRVVKERRIPHGSVEVVLTICEEIGLVGAKHFDVARLTARTGLVLDCDGVDELITRAPAANRMTFTVHGLAAHAGLCPERGLSAITIAGEAIAAMRLGRVDAETTANLGVIEGGLAANIVPDRVSIRGETRSLDVEKLEAQTAHMRDCFERAAAGYRVTLEGRPHAPRLEAQIARDYERLYVGDDAPVVKLLRGAATRLGRPFRTRASGGGSDANVFNAAGLEIANLGCGMRDIHTLNEWIDVRDMVATSQLLVEALRLHAEGAAGQTA